MFSINMARNFAIINRHIFSILFKEFVINILKVAALKIDSYSLVYADCSSQIVLSYLELAILPCWRFLLDQPVDSLRRLVMMTRGLGDPVASAYCRLYMAHCAQKLPTHDMGNLVYIIYQSLGFIKHENNKWTDRF